MVVMEAQTALMVVWGHKQKCDGDGNVDNIDSVGGDRGGIESITGVGGGSIHNGGVRWWRPTQN